LTSFLSHEARAEVPELILTLHNERPIPADDLGALFRALAADYRRLNRGRTLVIASLEHGSLIARLQEAYATFGPHLHTAWDIASAAKDLAEFAKTLRDLFSRAKHGPKEIDLFQRKSNPPGIKSVEAMVKLVINTGGEIEVSYKQRDEEISMRATSAEALTIRERAKVTAREIQPPPGLRDAESGTFVANPPSPQLYDAGGIADKLVEAGPGAQVIIEAVASALQEAGVLETVAAKLDQGGHHSLAMAVRAAASHRR
jgi:hypothetical protein